MNFGTLIVLVAVVGLMGLAVWSMLRSRKKGVCCGGNCKGCPHAQSCHK